MLLLQGGAIWPGHGGSLRYGHEVLIGDGYILAVRPDGSTTDEIATMDLRGHVLMPSLVNLHTHLLVAGLGGETREKDRPEGDLLVEGRKSAHRALGEGILLVRDMGSRTGLDIQLKEEIQQGVIPGPKMLVCGGPLGAPGGHCIFRGIPVSGPGEAAESARRIIQQGADFIKAMASGGLGFGRDDPGRPELSTAIMRAAFDAAKKAGTPTAVHAIGKEAIRNALDAGVDVIEHGSWLGEKEIRQMAENGTALVPTLSQYHNLASDAARYGRSRRTQETARRVEEAGLRAVRLAAEAGVRIGAGTDTCGDLVAEIGLLRAAGMSPEASLSAATATAARIAGVEEDAGEILENRRADLIAVRGNPLDDAEALRNPPLVIQGGNVVTNRLN